jgi:hypothetical protein
VCATENETKFANKSKRIGNDKQNKICKQK